MREGISFGVLVWTSSPAQILGTLFRTHTNRHGRGPTMGEGICITELHLAAHLLTLSFISFFTLFSALVCGYYVAFTDASCLALKTRKVSTLALAIIRSPCSATSYSATA